MFALVKSAKRSLWRERHLRCDPLLLSQDKVMAFAFLGDEFLKNTAYTKCMYTRARSAQNVENTTPFKHEKMPWKLPFCHLHAHEKSCPPLLGRQNGRGVPLTCHKVCGARTFRFRLAPLHKWVWWGHETRIQHWRCVYQNMRHTVPPPLVTVFVTQQFSFALHDFNVLSSMNWHKLWVKWIPASSLNK